MNSTVHTVSLKHIYHYCTLCTVIVDNLVEESSILMLNTHTFYFNDFSEIHDH